MALQLPEHFFESKTDRSFWCARIIGYPRADAQSCGEHTDYGCWTLLAQVRPGII